MFRRNNDDTTPASGTSNTETAPPLKPFSKNASHAPAKPPATTNPAGSSAPPRVTEPVAPNILRSERSHQGDLDSKKLIVGRDICLSGEITACERLIVEGRVEVSLTDARFIEVAASGYFKGNADVREADISGRFEGELIASERLTVRAGGKISGSVRYGSIVIEPGGQVIGDMQPLDVPAPAVSQSDPG